MHVGYPEREQEIEMLDLHSRPIVKLAAVSGTEEIIGIQQQLEEVYCIPELKGYIIDLVRHSRRHPDLVLALVREQPSI